MTDEQPDVTPAAEPDDEVSNPHEPPLEEDDDARHLRPDDPRRLEVERRLGKRFPDEGE